MVKRPIDPSPEDADAVIAFLPLLERPDFTAGVRRAPGDGQPGGFDASPELIALLQALHEHRFVYDLDDEFDWAEWQDVARHYVARPELLADAGLGTLCKLFTTHVRKEAFAPGHLDEMARSGHLVAALRRLRDLRTTARR